MYQKYVSIVLIQVGNRVDMCEWGIVTLIFRDSEDMKRSEDVNIERDISTHTQTHRERERERC